MPVAQRLMLRQLYLSGQAGPGLHGRIFFALYQIMMMLGSVGKSKTRMLSFEEFFPSLSVSLPPAASEYGEDVGEFEGMGLTPQELAEVRAQRAGNDSGH